LVAFVLFPISNACTLAIFIVNTKHFVYENINNRDVTENKAQTGKATKRQLPIKNAIMDYAKNIATYRWSIILSVYHQAYYCQQ